MNEAKPANGESPALGVVLANSLDHQNLTKGVVLHEVFRREQISHMLTIRRAQS